MQKLVQSVVTELTSKKMVAYIDAVAPTFSKVPHLPKGLVEFLASIAPWLAGLGGIVGILSGIKMILQGLGVGFTWWMELAGFSRIYFLSIGALHLVGACLLLLAFSPLRSRAKTGWILLFWNFVLSLVQSVVGILFVYAGMGIGSLLWTAIGVLLGLYILFEVRGQFSN